MSETTRYRLGVDVGGTHTDLVLLDSASGHLLVEKVASTPKNPALGVLEGVARFAARGIDPRDIAFFGHGTTITTNALLEMRGAKVGLLITKGYRAVQVSLSSEVLPRIREWPRLSSTLLNAYLEPVLVDYIAHLNKGLDESGIVTPQKFLMQSNGGVMSFSAAIEGGRTVHTMFSGP